MIASWPCPRDDGAVQDELAIAFDSARPRRLLILPALFDEANKLRQLTVTVMRLLDYAGIDSFLPDLPGCNESLQPLVRQDLARWRHATQAAAHHFAATHVLTIRAGAMLAPGGLPGWRYAPTGGDAQLRTMLRAAQIGAREMGRDLSLAALQETGRTAGMALAGYNLRPQIFADLEGARLEQSPTLTDIPQEALGESGLWLRAEPDMSLNQALALAGILIRALTP